MIKKVRVILSLFILLFSTQSIAEDKILFIDIEYVYINSVAGKKVSEFIVKERKKIDKDFSNYKKEIDEEKTKLMNQKNILSKEEFQKNTLSLQNKVNDLNKELTKKNNELIKYQNSAKIEFSQKLRSIVASYAKENSISMIIKKNNILIGKNELDATKDILVLVDKEIKSLKKN
tara:strand:- start:321 stop:845 length:525 start_codon:yes stop_codon:yes gene_type:complete